ncbi:osmosensitive K+ channel histidine kinase [Bifidobacterium lemurum]|uniref:histidine kinase n=1 Tax=Bifidobacterium lemurum TaxID=1603886 RepID=A0A261FQG7_9BIFI|nr:ATP-binding protein [Bifidobacterium lemurum]OZG61432.1 osmosensitive K+ channel histidine kinase [Bifidobacterium lemurum]QOL35138.1 sensor histidine kinase KdpD [Bifidobacterium lemurum]
MANTRGSLRVLLGAAPGVGKTYAMLQEGRRLRDEGKDVVIALLETHGRRATAQASEGLEQVPRRRVRYRGMWLDEMDLFKVVERAPQVALVDEFAHSNAPGSVHAKRWQDVEDLLDAGIDVITTINVQHIESLNDVVRGITGSEQRETVPDKVLRSATQIELVDLPPEGLRERLSAGLVYQPDRVDAALSNYFRLGNLTALRELALLWLAGRVDEALKAYRSEHHISAKWETRERVVVALSGGPEGEQLLRRGARVARASGGGDLMAVHVTSEDGLCGSDPVLLEQQRDLVEQLGGSYHQITGESIADSLLQFARANNATQIIVGVSRRSAISRWLGRPSSTNEIISKSGDIDVHVVTHAFAHRRMLARLRLPRRRRTMTTPRIALGFLFACLAVPAVAMLLALASDPLFAARDALVLQLIVVASALIGGVAPATMAAVLSGLALDYLYVAPTGSLHMPHWQDWLTMLLYVAVGVIVSFVVDRAGERARQAQRASAESEMLAAISGAVLRSGDPLEAIVSRTREAFGFTCVRVVKDGEVLASDGDESDGGESDVDARSVRGETDPGEKGAERDGRTGLGLFGADRVGLGPDGAGPARRPPDGSGMSAASAMTPSSGTIAIGDDGVTLELYGHPIEASDQRLLMAVASQILTVLEHNVLAQKAQEVEPLAAAEKMRTALLNAVSHDLRRPLASATAAVSGLRRMGDTMSGEDRDELLAVADESLGQLTKLVTDLLDVSRIREGALPLAMVASDVGAAIVPVLDERHIGPGKVDLDLDPQLPLVMADPPLLKRALANVVENAMRFTPEDGRIHISASAFNGMVEIRVADRGPGVPDERKADIFVPFHRLGDTDNTTGLGLGMALSKGFVESMGGSIEAEDTPGGGLTMVVGLHAADPALRLGQPIPTADIPASAERVEAATLAVSGMVSDVMLPLRGEASADVLEGLMGRALNGAGGRPDASGGHKDVTGGRPDASGGRPDGSGGRPETTGGYEDVTGGRTGVVKSAGRANLSGRENKQNGANRVGGVNIAGVEGRTDETDGMNRANPTNDYTTIVGASRNDPKEAR